MKTKEYGEIVVLFSGEKIPAGIVLRERNGKSVVLEEHYGEGNVDVLHVFETCNLYNKEDFIDCIIIARQYEGNHNVPIYIFSEKRVSVPEDLEEVQISQENKAKCLACMAEWNMRHPWSMSPSSERCDKCLKQKKTE